MAETAQTFTFRVPLDFDRATRQDVGEAVVEFIIRRTDKGLDKNNNAFPGYSDAYINSLDFQIAGKSRGDVNLQLSGDMLAELKVINTGVTGFVTVGFEAGTEENDRAAWNRNNTRPKFPKRDFLGITDNDLNRIIDRFKSRTPRDQEASSRLDAIAAALINNIFTRRN